MSQLEIQMSRFGILKRGQWKLAGQRLMNGFSLSRLGFSNLTTVELVAALPRIRKIEYGGFIDGDGIFRNLNCGGPIATFFGEFSRREAKRLRRFIWTGLDLSNKELFHPEYADLMARELDAAPLSTYTFHTHPCEPLKDVLTLQAKVTQMQAILGGALQHKPHWMPRGELRVCALRSVKLLQDEILHPALPSMSDYGRFCGMMVNHKRMDIVHHIFGVSSNNHLHECIVKFDKAGRLLKGAPFPLVTFYRDTGVNVP